jgi:asparagine synthetase B (glutamine-hydrolysing)
MTIVALEEPIKETPKILITLNNRGIDTQGLSSCSLGYKIPSVNDTEYEGIWADWKWHNKQFECTNDRYGFFPLFYFESGGTFGLSSSLIELLHSGAPRELNDPALAVFLRLGFFLAEDTPFKHVHAMPPAGHLSWRKGSLEVRSQAMPTLCAHTGMSRKSTMLAYGDLFQAAIERMLPDAEDKAGVPLSGGRDSRHITLALCKAGCPPHACLTMKHFPPKGDEDARVAQQVAAALGIRHIILEPAENRVLAEMRKNLLTHFSAKEHAWILPLADFIRREKYTLLYDGLSGDVLSAGVFLTEQRLRLYESGNLHLLAEHLLGDEGYLPYMLPASLYRRWNRELAVERLTRELARHVDAPNPVGQFFFWNKTRRQTALSPWSMLASPARVLAPFLDHSVYDFLFQIPAADLLDHTFHTDTISLLYPEYASIPYESKTASEKFKLSDFSGFSKQFCYFTLSKAGKSSYTRRSFLLPRILRALVDVRYATSLARFAIPAIYLIQLERVVLDV